ncbi:hypothetical protein F5Y04DRAFT_274533 [Hypomontagnella monticulosa]|nr:hypothetical protein F5Y04DRAFT_274533 [Hypomontagnella monticulosa]
MLDQDMSIVVFNMLPTSVQSRLPAFQSLRRSTSLSILSSRRRSITAQQKDIDPVVIARRDEDAVVQLQACTAAAAAATVTNSKTEKTKLKPSGLDGNGPNETAGVKWRYAAQGSYLQHSASQETADLAFARKSYIDGVAYMLKALPDDIDEYEASVIRQALPNSCIPIEMGGRIEAGARYPGWLPSDRAKTVLHSAVQGFVTGLVILFYFLLSFLAVAIRAGAYYERQYNISQHIVSGGFGFANAVGKRSGALSEKLYAIGEGKFGKVMSDLAAWILEGVAGGVQDGIGQGLLLIEQRRKGNIA